MKKILALTLALILAFALFTACTDNGGNEEGPEITVTVEVVDKDGASTNFTYTTKKTVLADLLLEEKLVEGDQGAYGLYITKVNGILADYDADRSYWALWVDGAVSYYGADQVKMTDGAHYKLVYTVE
jgi:hypothetical protein